LQNLVRSIELRATVKWFLLSTLIGVVTGLGAITFQFTTYFVTHYALENIAGYVPLETAGEHNIFDSTPSAFRPGLIILVMIVGGCVSGFLTYTFAPEAEGHGTDAAIDAYHNRRGYIRPRVPIIKTLASAVTLGTGGSGGREGPIAQIGAGFGSYLATRLKLPVRDRRILLAAGMGAGIGAIFRAPLAGALFAGEILYSSADLESDVLVPAAMSSIIGYSVYQMCLPLEYRFVPIFGNKLDYAIQTPLELIPLGILAVILCFAAVLFIKLFYGTHRMFARLSIPRMFRPALGAGIAGAAALAIFYLMGQDKRALGTLSMGHGVLQLAIEGPGSLGWALLLAIGLGKIFTTSFTIGSGGSGGVFGPSLLIGGGVGAAVGQLFHSLWPAAVPNPQIYGIVGMAGFFAGSAHAPISTIIMVSEMTGDYKLLLPSLWVSTLCFLLCRPWKLYHMQVATRVDSPVHRGDFIVDILEGLHVSDVPANTRPLVRVPEETPLVRILHILTETRQQYFPVTDPQDRMVGIFSADDVRAHWFDESLRDLVVARDVMTAKVVTVTPDDDLNAVLMRFTQINVDELPIVEPQSPEKLLGMLRRKDTIAVYNRRLAELKQSPDDEPSPAA
jgi:CIC family chloride channel protein